MMLIDTYAQMEIFREQSISINHVALPAVVETLPPMLQEEIDSLVKEVLIDSRHGTTALNTILSSSAEYITSDRNQEPPYVLTQKAIKNKYHLNEIDLNDGRGPFLMLCQTIENGLSCPLTIIDAIAQGYIEVRSSNDQGVKQDFNISTELILLVVGVILTIIYLLNKSTNTRTINTVTNVIQPIQDAPPTEVKPGTVVRDTMGRCVIAIIKSGDEYTVQHLSTTGRRNEILGLLSRSTEGEVSVVAGNIDDAVENLYQNGNKLGSAKEVKRRYRG